MNLSHNKILLTFTLLIPIALSAYHKGITQPDTILAHYHFQEGLNARKESNYKAAIKHFSNASDLFVNSSKHHTDRVFLQRSIEMKNLMGLCYIKLEELDTALIVFDKALSHAIKNRLENSFIAKLKENITEVYFKTARYDLCLKTLQEALTIYLNEGDSLQEKVGTIFHKMATAYWSKGLIRKAEVYERNAARIYKELFGKESIQTEAAYHGLGVINGIQGDYEEALKYFKLSLNIQQAQSTIKWSKVGTTYNNIGLTYWYQKKYGESLIHLEKALSIQLPILGENHTFVARAYHNLGLLHSDMGDNPKALIHYKKALTIYQNRLDEPHPDIARTLHNMGYSYLEMNDKSAIQYFRKSLKMRKQLFGEKNLNVAMSYNAISHYYMKFLRYDSALTYFQKSMGANSVEFHNMSLTSNPPLQHVFSDQILLESLTSKASILLKKSTDQASQKHLKLGLETSLHANRLVEKMRRNYKNEATQLDLAKQLNEICKEAIEISLALYRQTKDEVYFDLSFHFAELNKAAILEKTISDQKARSLSGIPDELLQLEIDLLNESTHYQQLINDEISKQDASDSALLSVYERKRLLIDLQIDSLLSVYTRDYPKYEELKHKNQAVSSCRFF